MIKLPAWACGVELLWTIFGRDGKITNSHPFCILQFIWGTQLRQCLKYLGPGTTSCMGGTGSLPSPIAVGVTAAPSWKPGSRQQRMCAPSCSPITLMECGSYLMATLQCCPVLFSAEPKSAGSSSWCSLGNGHRSVGGRRVINLMTWLLY